MKRRWLKTAIGAVLVVVLGWAGFVVMSRSGDTQASQLIGKPVPTTALARFDGGGTEALAKLGVVNIINFWAPWCVPCKAEHRLLGKMITDWSNSGVRLVGVSFQSSTAEVSTFLDEVGRGVPTFTDTDGLAAIDFGVVGVPETFVVDQLGTVRRRFAGAVTADELRNEVNKLLAENTAG